MNRKNLLALILLPFLFSCQSKAGKKSPDSTTVSSSAVSTNSASPISFDDFKLLPDEKPAGFITEPVSQESKDAGIFFNPGVAKGKQLISQLYQNAEPATIDSVYLEIFVKKGVSKEISTMSEMGVFVMVYKSQADLEKEIKKYSHESSSIYLRRDNFIVNVWSDANSFAAQTRQLADKLKKRLNLTEFKAAGGPVKTDTTIVQDSIQR